jgi:hypothetical protein
LAVPEEEGEIHDVSVNTMFRSGLKNNCVFICTGAIQKVISVELLIKQAMREKKYYPQNIRTYLSYFSA